MKRTSRKTKEPPPRLLGKDVIFDNAGDLPESAAPAVKQEIIRMLSKG